VESQDTDHLHQTRSQDLALRDFEIQPWLQKWHDGVFWLGSLWAYFLNSVNPISSCELFRCLASGHVYRNGQIFFWEF
ncbi:MAG TPA: hypothetical protein VL346_10235, partial [Acidobacteriaceae bacterium]|nr:hypothetical protein [Acidobacteriaceae bacterium]